MTNKSRIQKLIHMLLETDKPLTTSFLSQKLGVSSRTIRNDLNEIESQFLVYNLRMIKKPSLGIFIEGNRRDKDELLIHSGKELQIESIYSKKNRQNLILLTLLLNKRKYYSEQFAKKFFVSRSTVEKDIQEISNWIQKYKIQIHKKNEFMIVIGDEIIIRQLISRLATEVSNCEITIDQFFGQNIYNSHQKILTLIKKWDQRYLLHLSDVNIKNLCFHIMVAILRIEQQQMIQNTELQECILYHPEKHLQIQDFFDELEKEIGICLPKNEKNYLLIHLIGIILENNDFCDNPLMRQLKEIAEKISEDFIQKVEKIIPLGLSGDNSFKQSLILHLIPTLYRIKNGLNLYNPLLVEIKNEYTSSFALAKIINSSFRKYINIEMSEEEIAYIALHISVAVEKQIIPIKVAIVCSLGIGFSQLMKLKLEENFPMVYFDSFSYRDMEEISKCNFVLYTGVDSFTIPSLKVNVLLEKSDIKKVELLIHNEYMKNKNLFSKQTILIERSKSDKKAILNSLAYRLKLCGSVTDDFLQGVFKREEMGTTEVGNGIVLTHGFHKDVKYTQIGFLKLNIPILWNEEEVTFIVMLAIESKDAKNVMKMSWLYKFLNSKEMVKRINNSKTEQEIFEILTMASNQYEVR